MIRVLAMHHCPVFQKAEKNNPIGEAVEQSLTFGGIRAAPIQKGPTGAHHGLIDNVGADIIHFAGEVRRGGVKQTRPNAPRRTGSAIYPRSSKVVVHRQWRSRDADVQLLNARETAARVGSNFFRGALLDRRAGTIQPLAYARGLARAAVGLGVKIYGASPVSGVKDLGSSWSLQTRSGQVSAKSIIVATNAYSEAFWPGIRTELARLPYFNLATAPLPQALRAAILPERQGAWDTKQVLTSIRWDQEGRLIIGSVGALNLGERAIHEAWGRRTLQKLFPRLGKVKFQFHWHGWIGTTSDDLPRFHELGRNIYAFAGYNGRGIAPGTTFGRDLAGLATGALKPSDLSLPLSATAPIAFRAVKEGLYEFGSAALHAVSARI